MQQQPLPVRKGSVQVSVDHVDNDSQDLLKQPTMKLTLNPSPTRDGSLLNLDSAINKVDLNK